MSSFLPGWFPPPPSVNPVRISLTGSYATNYAGTTQITVTVPAVDLKLPASNSKQILVGIPTEVPTIASVTVNGVNAPDFMTASSCISYASAFYAGSGPFNIVVTIAATSTEIGQLVVWEVEDASPLYQGARNMKFNSVAAAPLPLPLRIPDLGQMVAASISFTDTITSTWSGGPVEDTDVDAGDYALSTAKTTGPQSGNTGVTFASVLNTQSGANVSAGINLAIAPRLALLGGGMRVSTNFTVGAGGFATGTSSSRFNNFTDMGNLKYIVILSYQDDRTITGVTHNGVAMSLIGHAVNTAATDDIHTYAFGIDLTQAAPSGNLVVTMSSAAPFSGIPMALNRYAFYNVGSISSIVTGTSAVAAGAALTVDVNQGSAIVGSHVQDVDANSTTWVGIDRLTDFSYGSSIRDSQGSKSYNNPEIARPIQATGSGAGQSCTLAFVLNP